MEFAPVFLCSSSLFLKSGTLATRGSEGACEKCPEGAERNSVVCKESLRLVPLMNHAEVDREGNK